MTMTKWTIDSLNKAYQQGYMTGLAGLEPDDPPYENDVLVAAWEAGWDDGYFQHRQALKDRQKNQSVRTA